MKQHVKIRSSTDEWVLTKPFYSLGRSLTADLNIHRYEASRIHTFFFRDPERGYCICDAGSRNGTYLNGKLAHCPTPLEDGDIVDVVSEPIHVSVQEFEATEPEDAWGAESVILLTAMYSDAHTDWGMESPKRSRCQGGWFYRTIKLIRSHGGIPVKAGESSVTAIWDSVSMNQQDAFQKVLECSRQINQFAKSRDEALRKEWMVGTDVPLFNTHAAMHYTPLKRWVDPIDKDYMRAEWHELELMDELARKAEDLKSALLCTERFQAGPDDRSATSQMSMVELGPRKLPMIVYPLRED
ncbi:MAG: FHA domain-containing protein [Verrucomicrobiota bacterium]